MADLYGLTTFPVTAPGTGEAVGDGALDVLLAFFKAAVNADAATAWDPREPGRPPVLSTFAHNPEQSFNDNTLPALFLWRSGRGQVSQTADGWFVQTSQLTLTWVMQSTTQAKAIVRTPFANALDKVLARAIHYGRHPAYVVDSDRADPDGLKTSIATSTSAHTYSGAALNGALAGTTFDPPRRVTVTRTSAAGAYTTTDITATGTDADAAALSADMTPPDANGGDTLQTHGWERFATVTSFDVPAQASTAGALTLGVGPSDDDLLTLGSLVLRHAGLTRMHLEAPGQPKPFTVRVEDGAPPRNYLAVEWAIHIDEALTEQASRYDALGAVDDTTAEIDITLSDGSVFETATLQ